MKRKLGVFSIFILAVFLLGCMKSRAIEETYKFRGVVKDIGLNGESATVVINEDDKLRKSAGDYIVVHLGKCDTDIAIGDKITVEYDGSIMESDPPQVNAIGIEVNGKDMKQIDEAFSDPLPDDDEIVCGFAYLNEKPNIEIESN